MNIAIIGGSGGIGRTFVEILADRPGVDAIHATYNRTPPPFEHPAVSWHSLDITDEAAIRRWAQNLGELDWLINAVGMLHDPEQGPEKSIRHLDPAFFMQNMSLNALPMFLLARHLQPHFTHGRPAIFATISAKVGSIEDNRLGGWYSYRASKAALNMGLKTLAIEWQRTLPNVTVAALHPGTTDTALSRPFQRHVPPGQLQSPAYTVNALLNVLDNLTPEQTGKFWAFDGEQLPW
ncbi:MAG: SDR family oxidoreductase [Thiohalophilus sp.]|uniref:SDR family oxidoreductase n=1 Tax=Thiohalophilus sp. TaxID=3028392 RepID=UPI0028707DF1|nr:SDR family oxidoreductase [Thiohalophilus sp.]MDR9436791.1 SDR family oxidoreductase [Thiohalophilus sp.]